MADSTRFILVNTSHAGNVGAAARAMKVMGFSQLVLVAPRRAGLAQEAEALAMASGATDVLQASREVATLDEALTGVQWLVATAMTPRDFGPPTFAPREHFASLALGATGGGDGPRVGFLFGPERTGLANDDVYRCHACVSVPTDPAYGSLNLAQAVQIVAYEWRQALGGFAVAPRTVADELADAATVQQALAHWQEALVAIGFLDPAAPKKLMPRLNQLLNRAALTTTELHILRGMAGAVLKAAHDARTHRGERQGQSKGQRKD